MATSASAEAKKPEDCVPIWQDGTHGRSMPAGTKLRAWPQSTSPSQYASHSVPRVLFALQVALLVIVLGLVAMMYKSFVLASAAALVDADVLNGQAAGSAMAGGSSSVPQYYQTTPEFLPGPTPTGEAAFLAQTNPAPFAGTVSKLLPA